MPVARARVPGILSREKAGYQFVEKSPGVVNIHYVGKFTKVQDLTFINARMKT